MERPSFGIETLSGWWDAAVSYAVPRLPETLALLLGGVLAVWVARKTLKRVQRQVVNRTETRLDDHILYFLHSAISFSIFGVSAWLLIHILAPDGPAGEAPRAATWVVALWVGGLFFPLSRFVGDVLTELQGKLIERTDNTFDETAMPLVIRTVKVLVLGVGVVIALDLMGLNIGPLLAGAGVMGLALSLAAKDTLSNLIAGVLLIMDRPFHVGDRIELWTAPNETGTWGDVIEVGLRATKIRNPDNLVVVVPNNLIMQRDIVNYTMTGDHIRLRIPFSVAYESDIEKAKRLLIEAALEVDGVLADPLPLVIVRGFGNSDVQIQLRVWVKEARSRRKIADEITGKALTSFATAGVEIPYPKRELWIRSVPDSDPHPLPGKPGGGLPAPSPTGPHARPSPSDAVTPAGPASREG